MGDLSVYEILDLSPVRGFMREHGVSRNLRKGEYFSRIDVPAPELGVVNSGGFAFERPDYKGNTQICTIAFADEFVGAYVPMIPGRTSGFDIRALCASEVSVLPLDDVIGFMDGISPDYRLRFTYLIAYSFMTRGISYRCDSIKSRYLDLLRRMPGVIGVMSTGDVASYLGVTRETLSRLRAKFVQKKG